ncbi:MAG TPA: isoleucine--tRNA ligase [Candidatus Baltobacteraceae bacterium]
MSETTVDRDYRDTLNLPKTDFPMKADLPKREPERVAWWQEQRTYERRLERNRNGAPWILHDGPPYANGNLHMGHFLNMVLKDIFVKIALLDGKWAKFVPGWDMHGLPIELETLKHLKIKDFHAIDPLLLRAQCKERALHWLDVQRSTRMRMGTFGDYAHPYRTVDPEFEATIVEALADLAEKNQLYKGLRSTLWCIHDETALAEAEIEYKEKTSPSIYVRFAAGDAQREALYDVILGDPEHKRERENAPRKVSVLIWTTTPWTLPANVAIALKADAGYALYRVGDEAIVVAEALAPHALGQRFAHARKLAVVQGEALDGLAVRHPFLDRDAAIVLADYVDLETGTGAVHTAPGHGADDFDTGVRYNLPILNPVDARGVFTADAGPYAGMHIWKANPKIVEDLRESGALWDAFEFAHSYPHCWRCHNPVIFRATAQWFIAMDQNRLRKRAIEAAQGVEYTPDWGRNRLVQMLENHPEWCISRQRTWGTPIPAVICLACNESILDATVARTAAARFRADGADSWWRDPVEAFLPKGFACPNCGGTGFEKEKNIVDIWFESGVTHLAVLGKDGLPWPSDLVLEGGDQYRGWFRSSIVTATAIEDRAPYKHVVKNGWVNDEHGRPMSKSLGTGIDANDAMNKWGADVLRLWAASVEFVDDVRFGANVVDQVSRVYRNIRNRARFILSNLADLTPSDVIARDALDPFDALACDVTDQWIRRVYGMLKTYNLHDAYLEIVRFEGDDLSSFYLDALKDRLYSSAATSQRRRSAQSALWYVIGHLLTALAPLLSFTAEEAWQSVPPALRGDAESVFDLTFDPLKHEDPRALDLWAQIKALRAQVAANGEIRDFEARATLEVGAALYAQLHAMGDGLREALVVSHLDLQQGDGPPLLSLARANGEKCRRCWKYLPLGSDPGHPALCAPCAAVVRELDAAVSGGADVSADGRKRE